MLLTVVRIVLIALSVPAPVSTAFPTAIILRVVEPLLLLRREQRTDLRHRVVHHCLGFLHRFTVDIFNLRCRLVDDRLDFCLLFRRKVQLFGRPLERVVTGTAAPALLVLCGSRRFLSKGGTAERKSAQSSKYDEFNFHVLCLMTGWNRSRLQFYFGMLSRRTRRNLVTETSRRLSSPLVWRRLG